MTITRLFLCGIRVLSGKEIFFLNVSAVKKASAAELVQIFNKFSTRDHFCTQTLHVF